jgi:hypothetical protein
MQVGSSMLATCEAGTITMAPRAGHNRATGLQTRPWYQTETAIPAQLQHRFLHDRYEITHNPLPTPKTETHHYLVVQVL